MKILILSTILLIFLLLISHTGLAQKQNLDSLLFEAVKANNIEQVKQLVEKGANVNEFDNYRDRYTPLDIASDSNFVDIAQILIENGADVNLCNVFSEAPFDFAISANSVEIAHLLIEKGVDINIKNSNGQSKLLSSISQNKTQIALFLLVENIDINVTDFFGNTALHYALKNDQAEIIKVLLSKKTNADIQNDNGETPLLLALKLNKTAHAKLLISLSGNLNLADDNGISPLIQGILNDNSEIVQLLIEKEVDVNQASSSGISPLAYASGNPEIENLLKNKGAIIMKQKPKLMLPLAHLEGIRSICFSPNGKYALSGSFDKTIKLWNLESGQEIRTFNGHTLAVTSINFSPDGKYFISGSLDKTIKLWDINSGNEIKTYIGHSESVISVCFSKDGKFALSGSGDLIDSERNAILLWDIVSGKVIRTFTGHTNLITCVCFSPNGKYILSSSRDKTIKLWDLANEKELRTYTGHKESVNSVCFSPDGKYILSGSNDKTIKLWDLADGKEIRTYPGHKESVSSVCFSEDGKFVLSGSRDKTIKLWDLANGLEIKTFIGHNKSVESACFSPDGKYVLSGSGDNTLKLWDITYEKEIKTFKGHTYRINSVCFSPDGKCIISSSGDTTIKLLDIFNEMGLKTFKGHADRINAVCFSNNGKFVLSGSGNDYKPNDISLRLWEVSTRKEIKLLKGHLNCINSACFSPNSKYCISGSDDHTIKLWDIDNGIEINTFIGHLYEVHSVCFSPDGNLLLSGSADATLKLWDITSGKEIKKFVGHMSEVCSVCFSPDGKYVLSGSSDGTLKIWEIATGQEINTLHGHTDKVNSVSFSPNGKTAFSGSSDNTCIIWDIETGKKIQKFKGHTNDINQVAFHPSGKFAISCSDDNTIKIWDLEQGKELATLIPIDSTDWVVTTPEGLFDATPAAMDMMHYVSGMEIIELNQLKDRYYEPGLLQKIMGFNKEPIRNVEKLDNIRLYPEIKDQKMLAGDLTFTLEDRGGGIGKIIVYLNGKEIDDKPVKQELSKDKKQLKLQYKLSGHKYFVPGRENEVEIKVYNDENWLQSRGSKVKYTEEKTAPFEKPNLYAVIVGVSDYSGTAIDLKYAAKDANSFARALDLVSKKLFGKENTHIALLSTDTVASTPLSHRGFPTKENIKKVVSEFSKTAKSTDILVIYLSGHGTTWGGQDGDFFYLTADAKGFEMMKDKAYRESATLSTDEITELFKEVPALKQVLIMDACHSGKAADDLLAAKDDISASAIRAYERMKDRTGMFVLAGSAGDAVSYEASKYGQGLLTYSLLFGMKDPSQLRESQYVDIMKLFQFAADNVPVLAQGIGGIQRPQVRTPQGGQSFDIGQVGKEEQDKIVIQQAMPVFLRSMIMDSEQDDDVLDISELIDLKLRENSSKGKDANLIFVDAKTMNEAYKLTGSYVQKDNQIIANIKLKKDKDVVVSFEVKAAKAEELAEMIIKEAMVKLK